MSDSIPNDAGYRSTLLVTGATGFIGRCLVELLRADRIRVRVMLRPSGNADDLAQLGAEIIRGDLLDPASLERAVDGCDLVYHLAAQMLAPGISRKRYFSINAQGTRNLARACARRGVQRLVAASSSGVYGIIHRPPVTEKDRINPTSPYRESKWLAEQAVVQELENSQTEYVIARLSGLMGPGSMNWLGLSQAISGGRFRIIGTGENHDNVAYVSDVARGIRLCGETPAAAGRVYLIGGNPSARINDIVTTIAGELGVTAPSKHLPVAPYRVYNWLGESYYKLTGHELPGVHRYALFLADKILDLGKAERELGYVPEVSLSEGVKQTIAWYRAKGLIRDC